MTAWNDPWSTGFDWGTVEADPDLSAALQERTDQRDEARRRITALEEKLAAVRWCVAQYAFTDDGPQCYCFACRTLRIIDAELVAE